MSGKSRGSAIRCPHTKPPLGTRTIPRWITNELTGKPRVNMSEIRAAGTYEAIPTASLWETRRSNPLKHGRRDFPVASISLAAHVHARHDEQQRRDNEPHGPSMPPAGG